MSTRYIQAAVTKEEYATIAKFAIDHDITLGSLIKIAALEYIENQGKEEQTRQGLSKEVGQYLSAKK